MNFLAHLWLAEQSRTSLAGSVLGDVIHGADLSAYPAEIATGVRLHRRIDGLTDRHPVMRAARARWPPDGRRYAGIVLDLVADYCLIQDWWRYSDEPLQDFCRRCGEAIEAAAPWFVQAGGWATTAGDFTHLLQSYGTAEGIDRAIRRTAQRLKRPEPLLATLGAWPAAALALRPELAPLMADLRQAALATEQTASNPERAG